MFSKNYAESASPVSVRHWRRLLIDTAKYINLCIQIKHEREILAKLSDSELRDIGVHRGEADAECRRSFLDVPNHRRSL